MTARRWYDAHLNPCRYQLGRRFHALDVGGEGEEARLAFQLLIELEFEVWDESVEVDRRWLTSLKAARHLAVIPPVRTDAATGAFCDQHTAAYLAVRQRNARTAS